jgi:hypothetical protein
MPHRRNAFIGRTLGLPMYITGVNEELKMKGVYGCENISTRKQPLPGFRSRLFENQGTRFILHFSFFIIRIKNEE